MPRRRRVYPDGLAFHVINRGNRRSRIFLEPADYENFLSAMATAAARTGMRVLAFCLMPNHWHLVVWPLRSRDLSSYMQLLMNRHIRVHQRCHGTSGTGHIYQGRFKSVAIEDERELLRVCRYVDANPLRAGLVGRAEEWPWSDLSRQATNDGTSLLTDWPSPRPADWLEIVNRPQSEKMVDPIRRAIVRARRLVSMAKDDKS